MLAAPPIQGVPANDGWITDQAGLLSAGQEAELEALAEVFGSPATPVPLGSLKSNLGHLITTAGVAELADAVALGATVLWTCRFESCPRHHRREPLGR